MQVEPLTRRDLDLVVEWAAAEGWNPGRADADVFWTTDPEGFFGVRRDGELIASGSIVSYGGEFGFLGFFIVLPELRGQGLGRELWYWLRDELFGRLQPGAAIGIDGVFDMQPFYAGTGFRFSHRNLRMRGTGRTRSVDSALRPLAELPFDEITALDRRHFGFDRRRFLAPWIQPAGGLGLGLMDGRQLRGIGVARPCREGFKIGPLFAENEACAETILGGLGRVTAEHPVFLDVPENNPAALALAERHGLEEVFGCARMYHGEAPALPWDRIFGVTTFELG